MFSVDRTCIWIRFCMMITFYLRSLNLYNLTTCSAPCCTPNVHPSPSCIEMSRTSKWCSTCEKRQRKEAE